MKPYETVQEVLEAAKIHGPYVKRFFEHYYLNEGDLESLDTYFVAYDKIEKMTANGYNCYYLTGEYALSEEELDTEFAYYFHACVFATKEKIFTIVF